MSPVEHYPRCNTHYNYSWHRFKFQRLNHSYDGHYCTCSSTLAFYSLSAVLFVRLSLSPIVITCATRKRLHSIGHTIVVSPKPSGYIMSRRWTAVTSLPFTTQPLTAAFEARCTTYDQQLLLVLKSHVNPSSWSSNCHIYFWRPGASKSQERSGQ